MMNIRVAINMVIIQINFSTTSIVSNTNIAIMVIQSTKTIIVIVEDIIGDRCLSVQLNTARRRSPTVSFRT